MNDAHDLVIGGSGMLAGLCVKLASDGRTVSVIARNVGRLDRLAERTSSGPGRIVPVPVDYRDGQALCRAMATLLVAHGRPGRTICWVHDEVAPDAPLQIAEFVDGIFWHVLGSAAADPARPDIVARWRERFGHDRPYIDYRHIILGSVTLAGGRSRWLTDAEISDGVGAALTGPHDGTAFLVPNSVRAAEVHGMLASAPQGDIVG